MSDTGSEKRVIKKIRIEGHASSLTQVGERVSRTMKSSLAQVGTLVSWLLLVPIYTFFLLSSFPELKRGLRDHLPAATRERVLHIAARIDQQVAAFFRGKLLLCLLKGLVTWIGLWICGIPSAFAIGMSAGLLAVVPFVGPLVCGLLAAFLAYGAGDPILVRVVGVGLSFAAAEGVEAVAQPVILGREVGIPPLVLVLSFFVFGELFGLFGVLLEPEIEIVWT